MSAKPGISYDTYLVHTLCTTGGQRPAAVGSGRGRVEGLQRGDAREVDPALRERLAGCDHRVDRHCAFGPVHFVSCTHDEQSSILRLTARVTPALVSTWADYLPSGRAHDGHSIYCFGSAWDGFDGSAVLRECLGATATAAYFPQRRIILVDLPSVARAGDSLEKSLVWEMTYAMMISRAIPYEFPWAIIDGMAFAMQRRFVEEDALELAPLARDVALPPARTGAAASFRTLRRLLKRTSTGASDAQSDIHAAYGLIVFLATYNHMTRSLCGALARLAQSGLRASDWLVSATGLRMRAIEAQFERFWFTGRVGV